MKFLNKCLFWVLISSLVISCNGQNKKENDKLTFDNEIRGMNKIPLPENGFYCGFLDSKGNIWLGSRGNGVFKYDGKEFKNYTKTEGLCDNNISCITEDKKGNIWLGTTSGVCKFDGRKFIALNIPYSDISTSWLDKVYPIINPNQVMAIYEDKKGSLWLGTNGAGVYQYSEGIFTQHLSDIGKVYEDGLQHNIVLSIVGDMNGNIWFTSLSHGGVSVYDGEKFTHYIKELSDDFIRTAFCDTKGNIWIGTHGNRNGGLDKFDGEKFTSFYKTNDGFHNNNVRWIYEDKTGLLWLGSGTTELTTFNGSKFEVVKNSQGKTYDRITFVIGDSKDHIWFGNREGLWMFNGKDIIEMTD